MSDALEGAASGPVRIARRGLAALDAVDWLGLAAAPTFAVMALLASDPGGGKMATICAGMPERSPLGGMVAMYLLMSGFHLTPWLKLVSHRR